MHAVFNEGLQSVEMPLDKYVNSPDEYVQIATANFYQLKACVVGKGQPLTHHYYQTEYRSVAPFGVWSRQYAERYGYELHNELGRVYVGEGVKGEETPQMQTALEECASEVEPQEIPVILRGVSVNMGPETATLGEVSEQVTMLVAQDSDVKSAIEEWTQCLAKEGISMDTQYENPLPVIPEDKEAQIKQALIDVQCKKDTRLMERYFDAQAQYEQALIEKNQATFNTLAETKAANLEKARAALRENGVTP